MNDLEKALIHYRKTTQLSPLKNTPSIKEREETDKEVQERMEFIQKREEAIKKQELQQLEILKKKYNQ